VGKGQRLLERREEDGLDKNDLGGGIDELMEDLGRGTASSALTSSRSRVGPESCDSALTTHSSQGIRRSQRPDTP
jgi:hypothetical protein